METSRAIPSNAKRASNEIRYTQYEMPDTRLVLIKFKVRGNLRFLSHAEMVKVFQRACVRGGIKVAYSRGFNPRPRLSLPLPKSVGVESDEDLLCLQVQMLKASDNQSGLPALSFDTEVFKAGLSSQLPDGCELLTVTVVEAKASIQPSLATYMLVLRREYINEKLKATIKRLLASGSLNLQRQIDAKGNIRNVDVRPFLKSIEFDDRSSDQTRIVVECKISSAGSIRVDEILKLLELDYGMLAAPIRRTNVQFVACNSSRPSEGLDS